MCTAISMTLGGMTHEADQAYSSKCNQSHHTHMEAQTCTSARMCLHVLSHSSLQIACKDTAVPILVCSSFVTVL